MERDHLSSHLSDISDQSSVIVVMGQGEGGVRGNVVFQSTQYEVNTGQVNYENYKYQPVNTSLKQNFIYGGQKGGLSSM